jgi:molybdopterin molybdotransferase/putative molybdopterin biosynthesis protein
MKPRIERAIPRMQMLEQLFARWHPEMEIEMIPLDNALNRVIAKDLYSQNDLPVFRASCLDGIAVRSIDFANGLPDTRKWKLGEDYVFADTGDDFDDAFDAVIMIENVTQTIYEPGIILVPTVTVEKGQGIRQKGEIVARGDLLVSPYTRLKPLHLALLAMGGVCQVPVLKKPRVAFIPTGNELVPMGTVPKRGENIDANSVMIEAELQNFGAEPICYPIVKDKIKQLKEVLENAVERADIVIVNAGSSMGSEDLSVDIMSELGEVLQHGIASAPGYPIAFAFIEHKPVINLPGPTIAAFCGMDWAVREMVNHCLRQSKFVREVVTATLTDDLSKWPPVETYNRMFVTCEGDRYYAQPIPRHAHTSVSMAQCNGLHIAPIGIDGYKKGQELIVELLCMRSEIPNHNQQ